MRLLPVALVLLVAVGCSSPGEPPDTEPASLIVTTAAGSVDLDVEIADTPEERAHGLMFREELAPLDGMVFSWAEPTYTTFWMKNTLIPLSIAFWDERGRIVAMLDMEPCRDGDDCPTYDPGTAFIGAVEVAQGAFDDHGIEIGNRVELVGAG